MTKQLTGIVERIQHHWINPESYHQQIAVSFLWVSLFVFIGKIAGAAKEMVIAWRYGVSSTVDAYVFLFNIINWPVSIWFSVMSVVLIPTFVRLRREDNAGLHEFRSELYGLVFLLGFGLAIGMGFFFSQTSLLLTIGGMSTARWQVTVGMIWPLALCVPLAMTTYLLATETMARRRHGNTLLEGIPSAVLGLLILVTAPWDWHILAIGTLMGFFAQCVAMFWYLQRFDSLPRPRLLSLKSPVWSTLKFAIATMLVAQILQALTTLVDTFWAARLGEGTLAAMGYANRVLALILGLGATAISRAMLPILSLTADHEHTLRYRMTKQWSLLLFGLGLATASVVWLTAPWIIRLLFERGSFSATDTILVADLLRWASLQLPFYFAGLVWVALIASRRKYYLLIFVGVGNLIVKIGVNILAVPVFMAQGLYLGTACLYCFAMFACWYAAMNIRPNSERYL